MLLLQESSDDDHEDRNPPPRNEQQSDTSQQHQQPIHLAPPPKLSQSGSSKGGLGCYVVSTRTGFCSNHLEFVVLQLTRYPTGAMMRGTRWRRSTNVRQRICSCTISTPIHHASPRPATGPKRSLSNLFKSRSRGGSNAKQRLLVPSNHDSISLLTPFVVWGVLICVLYAVGEQGSQ